MHQASVRRCALAGRVMGLAVVPMCARSAADIVQQLRAMADDIEKGVQKAECIICIVEPDPESPPARFVWGINRPTAHVIGLLFKVASDFA